MTAFWISPDRLFDGHDIVTQVCLKIEDGRVVDQARDVPDAKPVKGCVAPGFVDLQVNGGGGLLLNSAPSRGTLGVMARAHRAFGTVAILPTVITDVPAVLDKAVDATLAAKGDDGLIGLHIEGPHIALERRGTHEPSFIRPLDEHTLSAVKTLRAHNVPVMITLAPEAASTDHIATLAGLGAVVSLGHTNAPADLVERAIAAGASCGTHLFNAMSPMQGRAPGAVGAILNAGLHFGIICDGYHVDYAMIGLALRATTHPERAFVVSDAMATIGGADHFDLYGRAVHLEEGRLINTEGNLAGAHVTQADAVRNLVQHVGIPLDHALRMAVTTPAHLIGAPALASIENRSLCDLVVVSDDLTVTDLSREVSGLGGSLDAAE